MHRPRGSALTDLASEPYREPPGDVRSAALAARHAEFQQGTD